MINYRISKYFPFLFVLTVMFSCSGQQKYPSITETPTRNYHHGNVVWRELASPDPDKSAEFYKRVFGWTFTKSAGNERPYWVIKNNGKSIGGMFELGEKYKNAGAEWVCSISVPSVRDAVNTMKQNGGMAVVGPMDLEGRGNLALVNDPQKAQLIVLNSVSGDPEINRSIKNQWLWSELWSNNLDESERFYKSFLNAETERKKDDDREYVVVKMNGEPCMGIIKNPAENVRSHFVQYILVDDVNSVFEKAKSNGAKVLIAPSPEIRKGTVAVLIDPTGAPFAIQKWPIE